MPRWPPGHRARAPERRTASAASSAAAASSGEAQPTDVAAAGLGAIGVDQRLPGPEALGRPLDKRRDGAGLIHGRNPDKSEPLGKDRPVPTTDGADTEPPDDLEAAIGAIYGGSLDEFVAGRDGLARAEGRGPAGRCRGCAQAGEAEAPRLGTGRGGARRASEVRGCGRGCGGAEGRDSGSDVREATNAPRRGPVAGGRGVRAAAASGGAALDQSELVPAVLAVAADPEALATLRAGRLVDVPSAGAFGARAPARRAPAPSSRAEARRRRRRRLPPHGNRRRRAAAGLPGRHPAPEIKAAERGGGAGRGSVRDRQPVPAKPPTPRAGGSRAGGSRGPPAERPARRRGGAGAPRQGAPRRPAGGGGGAGS